MTRRPVSDSTFRRWVKSCRALFPLDRPVRVRRVRLPRLPGTRRVAYCGECRDTPSGWEIRIEETLDRASTADTLIHEWTHALRDEQEPEPGTDHDASFWILFGSLYRAFFEVP